MKMRPVAALVLFAALVFSAVAPATGQSPRLPEKSTPTNPGARTETQAIFVELREQWAGNLHAKRVEASVAEYAPDAEFIDPNGTVFQGRAALRQLFQTVTSSYDSDLQFHSQRVEVSGNLAYDSGRYHETLTDRATGKAQELSGRYLTVYRRSGDGVWRIVEQIWPAMEKPEAPVQ
jgi:ketosteroid isomerase-like protein